MGSLRWVRRKKESKYSTFTDEILGLKISFEKVYTQMYCEFMFITLLLEGQFRCSFREFVFLSFSNQVEKSIWKFGVIKC